MKIVDVSHLKESNVTQSKRRAAVNYDELFMRFYMSMYTLDDDSYDVGYEEEFTGSELYSYLTHLNRTMWQMKPQRATNMKRTQQNIRKGQIYKSRFASLWVTYIEVTKLDGCIQLAN